MSHLRSNAAMRPLRWIASWWNGRTNGALLYSLLCTCKLHSVDPFANLCAAIARISEHKANRLIELLPLNWIHLVKKVAPQQVSFAGGLRITGRHTS